MPSTPAEKFNVYLPVTQGPGLKKARAFVATAALKLGNSPEEAQDLVAELFESATPPPCCSAEVVLARIAGDYEVASAEVQSAERRRLALEAVVSKPVAPVSRVGRLASNSVRDLAAALAIVLANEGRDTEAAYAAEIALKKVSRL